MPATSAGMTPGSRASHVRRVHRALVGAKRMGEPQHFQVTIPNRFGYQLASAFKRAAETDAATKGLSDCLHRWIIDRGGNGELLSGFTAR
jgi:hypothetical protein